jgi:ComF family protein
MQHIKYFNKKNLAFYMGKLMAEIAPSEIFANSDLVTAVPLHWLRRLHRGYNQAEWFARGIVSQHRNLKLLKRGLVRIRRTKTQVKLDRSDRTTNVKGAFKYKEQFSEHLHGKSILLIDDVITTGATTASCTEALLAGGCRRVKVLSLARD